MLFLILAFSFYILTNFIQLFSCSYLQLAYLPYKRRDLILDDENAEVYVSTEGNVETAVDVQKGEKKTKKHGLLNWLKPRVCCSGSLTSLSHNTCKRQKRIFETIDYFRGKMFSVVKFLCYVIYYLSKMLI